MLLLDRRFLLTAKGSPADAFDPRLAEVVVTVPPSAEPTVIVVRTVRPKWSGRAVLGFAAPPEVNIARAEIIGRDGPKEDT